MTRELEDRLALFIKNRDIMKQSFKWDNALIHPLCGILYTQKGLEVNPEKIKMCKEIIKNSLGAFSNFRGTLFLVIATMLSLEEYPEQKLNQVIKVYQLLKDQFYASLYLPITAFTIANHVEPYDYEQIVLRTKNIYQQMKSDHPFLTSSEDCTFAALFAIRQLTSTEDLENCYRILKESKITFSSNAVQTLSHVLAMGEENTQSKCAKLLAIINQLRERKCKYGTGNEIAILGVHALLSDQINQTVNDITEVFTLLSNQKGFGAFSIGKPQRLMYSAILVADDYMSQNQQHDTINSIAINSVTSIIIAQQVAITAAVSSSVAASTASNT